MAEIYRQQIEHKASGATPLSNPTFKDYVTQGLNDVAEGFGKLDRYLQDVGNKQLAAHMDLAVQEADQTVTNWKDFSAEGRNDLMAKVMGIYDQQLNNAPVDAQNRFDTVNPDARKIFELKVQEKVLKMANQHIFDEKKRDMNALADATIFDQRGRVRNANQVVKMMHETVDFVTQNPDDILSVKQLGELVDIYGHKAAVSAIGQAIVDGRSGDAYSLLRDPYVRAYLGPEEKINFQSRVESLIKSQQEDKKNGGGYEDYAQWLISLRDGMYAAYGNTPDAAINIDKDMNEITDALKSGKSLTNLTILKWLDGAGRPANDVLVANGLKVAAAWDSLPMTARQLAVTKYDEIVTKALPTEYKDRQNYLANSFSNRIASHITTETDDDGNEIISVDISNMTNNEMRDALRDAEELRNFRIGLDNSVVKTMNNFLSMAQAKKYEAAKAASFEFNEIQQEMSGLTAGKTFLGGGNLTEAMVRAEQKGESRPSIIDGMMNNMAVKRSSAGLVADVVNKVQGLGIISGGIGVSKIGDLLETGPLSKYQSDFSLYYTGGEENAKALSASVGTLMRELGEVDSKGNLTAPKADTYRYMTYAIPVIMSYISVMGNEDDLKNTGIKPGYLNGENTVDLTLALQNIYSGMLDKSITKYQSDGAYAIGALSSGSANYGAFVDETNAQQNGATRITESDPYNMLKIAFNIAQRNGYISEKAEINEDSIISIAAVLNGLISNSDAETQLPAKSSGAQKRIDAKTKTLQQRTNETKKKLKIME